MAIFTKDKASLKTINFKQKQDQNLYEHKYSCQHFFDNNCTSF